MMLRLPAVIDSVVNDDEVRQRFSAMWRPIVDGIVAEWQEHENIDISRFTQDLPPEIAGEMASLALEGDNYSDAECAKIAADCLAHMRRKDIKARKRDERSGIRAAEEQNDEKAKRERILEWQDLVRKERQLERPKLEPKTTLR
jgi:hypothetical protein